MAVIEKKAQVEYSDIKKFMGVSANLQQRFLNKYEPEPPTFPAFQENRRFVSTWNCNGVDS